MAKAINVATDNPIMAGIGANLMLLSFISKVRGKDA